MRVKWESFNLTAGQINVFISHSENIIQSEHLDLWFNVRVFNPKYSNCIETKIYLP